MRTLVENRARRRAREADRPLINGPIEARESARPKTRTSCIPSNAKPLTQSEAAWVSRRVMCPSTATCAARTPEPIVAVH